MYYSDQAIEEMYEKLAGLMKRRVDLSLRFTDREYVKSEAKEYAIHGFCRRLGVMGRTIDNVFSLLPVESKCIPEKETIDDATINIHAFLVNAIGCYDNLAWIWVHEKSITQKNGSELSVHMVGLRKDLISKTFPKRLKLILKESEEHFKNVNNFRNALCHRISPYIPPEIVPEKCLEVYLRIEKEMIVARLDGDIERHKSLIAEQHKLISFYPWLRHSFVENSKSMMFHPAMIDLFYNICEIGEVIWDCLECRRN